jgi:uncharacterized protein (TIGR00299 family) protein
MTEDSGRIRVRLPHGGHSHGGHSHGGHSHSGHSHGGLAPTGHAHGASVEAGFVVAPRPLGSDRPLLARGAGQGLTLFVDMPSGIAGDMTIAGLLDLGVPRAVVDDAIDALGLSGVSIEIESGYAGAIGATHVDVTWPKQDGERSFREIESLISSSKLAESVKQLALSIFERLARAEADVHRTTLDDVHFHEVGAVDAIVDIVGAAAAFEYLGAEVKASPVPLGRGFVDCRHGRLPLPAPATLNCLHGVPTVDAGLEVELVTPTGAAIIATVAREFGAWFPVRPLRIGWGAGTRGLPDRPNALRMILGSEEQQAASLTHALLEANLDDMTGELAAHALNTLLREGALDAWVVPIVMKKGRPGMILSALCEKDQTSHLSEVILRETTSLGVRQSLVSRRELIRSTTEVMTPWGVVRVKISGPSPSLRKAKPEFDDCVSIAEREGLPLRTVLLTVQNLLSVAEEDGTRP